MKIHVTFSSDDEFGNPPSPVVFAQSIENLIVTSAPDVSYYSSNTAWLKAVAETLQSIITYRQKIEKQEQKIEKSFKMRG